MNVLLNHLIFLNCSPAVFLCWSHRCWGPGEEHAGTKGDGQCCVVCRTSGVIVIGGETPLVSSPYRTRSCWAVGRTAQWRWPTTAPPFSRPSESTTPPPKFSSVNGATMWSLDWRETCFVFFSSSFPSSSSRTRGQFTCTLSHHNTNNHVNSYIAATLYYNICVLD